MTLLLAYKLRKSTSHKLCFYSGRIRSLVAMAIRFFHRLIMGKEKIDSLFLSQWGHLLFSLTEMFIEKSSKFHMASVRIAAFNW